VFGDFSRYFVRLVGGIRFERSDEYAFNADLITYRALLRGDGALMDTTGAVKYRRPGSGPRSRSAPTNRSTRTLPTRSSRRRRPTGLVPPRVAAGKDTITSKSSTTVSEGQVKAGAAVRAGRSEDS
jgi:hypothetical protein